MSAEKLAPCPICDSDMLEDENGLSICEMCAYQGKNEDPAKEKEEVAAALAFYRERKDRRCGNCAYDNRCDIQEAEKKMIDVKYGVCKSLDINCFYCADWTAKEQGMCEHHCIESGNGKDIDVCYAEMSDHAEICAALAYYRLHKQGAGKMTVKSIVKNYLSEQGYDGLCNDDDCGCGLNDLMPCESAANYCKAAHFIACKKCNEDCNIRLEKTTAKMGCYFSGRIRRIK